MNWIYCVVAIVFFLQYNIFGTCVCVCVWVGGWGGGGEGRIHNKPMTQLVINIPSPSLNELHRFIINLPRSMSGMLTTLNYTALWHHTLDTGNHALQQYRSRRKNEKQDIAVLEWIQYILGCGKLCHTI